MTGSAGSRIVPDAPTPTMFNGPVTRAPYRTYKLFLMRSGPLDRRKP
jgi:hypothetical protein